MKNTAVLTGPTPTIVMSCGGCGHFDKDIVACSHPTLGALSPLISDAFTGLVETPSWCPVMTAPRKAVVLDFKKTAAPPWSENVDQRIAWAVWHLRENGHLYLQFRRLADQYLARGNAFSAKVVLNVMRFVGRGATGDVFAVNNNLEPLFARLYMLERRCKFEQRKCWLDLLGDAEFAQILTAFAPLREVV